jgi:predicted nucleic acid-binding protein
MLVTQIAPNGPLADEHAERLRMGAPITLASTSLMEMLFGLRKGIGEGNPGLEKPLLWWKETVAAGDVEVLPLTAEAAMVAGEVRALHAVPPAVGHRRRRGKAEARVGWVNDIQIGATAWVHGRAVRTSNRDDFAAIADALERLAPKAPRLELLPG